jgi:nucleoside-diphosphate-sugar epimerase
MTKTILVTGGAGYVGSTLVTALAKDGNHVKCLDRFFFGMNYPDWEPYKKNIKIIKDDIRWFNPQILDDVDVVMDLAALSNDPVADLDPVKTYDINYLGRSRVARLSKQHGVKQYILASSGSSYGINKKEKVNEDSPLSPLTIYAKANRMAEIDNLSLNDESFPVTVLRFSSIYGVSQRMRFDISVNSMTIDLYNTGKILVTGDGNQWRPFLHIDDAIDAYQLLLDTPLEKISGEIFNVGSDDQNFDLNTIAKTVGDSSGLNYEIIHKSTHDDRYYIVSFEKIKKSLGFVTKRTIQDGVPEMINALKNGIITDSLETVTIEWYKHLINSQKLVKDTTIKDTIL